MSGQYKNSVTNTSKNPRPEWTMGGNPDAIEAQEAKGQEELNNSDVLPSDMNGGRAAFEELGFVFGELVDGDPMFIEAKLPEGWKIEATDHSMWSKIFDSAGRERVAVFYKAAFYDRSANMRLVNQ